MKILVCGGRYYSNLIKVEEVLSSLNISCLIVGDASGADYLAAKWARLNSIIVKKYPADWRKYGNAAGPIRNKRMLDDNPDIELVIAFPGGKGTQNMCIQAEDRNIEVRTIE